jgi:hypothetical protein
MYLGGAGRPVTGSEVPTIGPQFRDLPRGFFADQKRFSPRLGFSFGVFSNGKLAVRAGSGVTYERIPDRNRNRGGESAIRQQHHLM